MFKFFQNSIFGFGTQSLLLFSSLLLSIFIGKEKGPDLLGQLSFVISFVNLFSFLPDLGINLYLIREISRRKDRVQEYINNGIGALIIIAPISFIVIFSISQLVNIPDTYLTSIYLGIIYLIGGTFSGLFRSSFYAFEKMGYETITSLFERSTTLIGSICVLLFGGGLFELILVHTLARILSVLISIFIYRRKISNQLIIIIDYNFWFNKINQCLPFALNTFTTSIYIQIDLVLITLLIGDHDAGIYKAATGLVIPMAIIASSVNSALFPEMARSYSLSIERSYSLIKISIKNLFIIGWSIFIALALLSTQIIELLYGDEFSESALPLMILAIIIPLRFVNNSIGTHLTAMNRQTFRAIVIFGSAVFNLVINLFFIPKWSFIGASISTVLTELLITIFLYSGLKYDFPKFNILSLCYKSVISSIPMVIFLIFTKDLNLFLSGIVALLIYLTGLVILNEIPYKQLFATVKRMKSK